LLICSEKQKGGVGGHRRYIVSTTTVSGLTEYDFFLWIFWIFFFSWALGRAHQGFPNSSGLEGGDITTHQQKFAECSPLLPGLLWKIWNVEVMVIALGGDFLKPSPAPNWYKKWISLHFRPKIAALPWVAPKVGFCQNPERKYLQMFYQRRWPRGENWSS